MRGSLKELTRGAHVPRPTQTVDVLVGGAVDGCDGPVAQLQPLTVEQDRHRVEKVTGEQASVSGREAHRGPKRREPAWTSLGIPGKTVDSAGVRVRVGQLGEAESAPVRFPDHLWFV